MNGVDAEQNSSTLRDRRSQSEFSLLHKEIVALKSTLDEITAIQAPLLGIKEVAKGLGKSTDTISRWVKDRVISCYKIPNGKGYVYLFSWKQLEDDLRDYTQPKI